jgi:amino-acid N-acetyltransferase
MEIRDAKASDLDSIKALLVSTELPSADIHEHLKWCVVCEERGLIVGVGCLEVYDNVGLIRSIAVRPEQKNRGIGKLVCHAIEQRAYNLGISTLYLLTETAEEYFSSLGFSAKDRSDAHASIANTKQFKSLCPSTATLMAKGLSDCQRTKEI